MGVTRAQIEAAAPDQAALKAAGGLPKPGKWPLRAVDAAGALVWGECHLMAAALRREDIHAWDATEDIKLLRAID